MAVAHIQDITIKTSTGTSSKLTSNAFGSSLSIGNLVVAWAVFSTASGTFSDSDGNTWYTDITILNSVTGNRFQIGHTYATTTNPLTISFTPSGYSLIELGASEFSGVSSGLVAGGSAYNSNYQSYTTSVTSNSAGTEGVNYLAIGGGNVSSTFVLGGSWTQVYKDNAAGATMEGAYYINSGPQTFSGTQSAASAGSALVVYEATEEVISPTITSISDSTLYDGQTGVVISGTNYTYTGNEVHISSGPSGTGTDISQIITDQGTTHITFTSDLSSFNLANTVYLRVETASGTDTSDTNIFITANPEEPGIDINVISGSYNTDTGIITKIGEFQTELEDLWAHTIDGGGGGWVENWYKVLWSNTNGIMIGQGLGNNNDVDVEILDIEGETTVISGTNIVSIFESEVIS